MDDFWMEVEWIQQRGEVKKGDCGGDRSQLQEGEASWACKWMFRSHSKGSNVSGPTHDLEHRVLLCLDYCHSLSISSVFYAIVKKDYPVRPIGLSPI